MRFLKSLIVYTVYNNQSYFFSKYYISVFLLLLSFLCVKSSTFLSTSEVFSQCLNVYLFSLNDLH